MHATSNNKVRGYGSMHVCIKSFVENEMVLFDILDDFQGSANKAINSLLLGF